MSELSVQPRPSTDYRPSKRFSAEPFEDHGEGDDLNGDEPSLRHLIEEIVADIFEVEIAALRGPTRGRARSALARQVAMYIAHVGLSLTLTEVGNLFGRDRTTVAHACQVVERRRDDDQFDEAVVLLEMIVRALTRSGVMGGRAMPVDLQPRDSHGYLLG